MSYSYRKLKLSVTLVVVVTLVAALPQVFAQYRGLSSQRKSPRAVAVIRIDEKGKAVLFPVSILDQGKLYDAGLYRSTPAPMALMSDTLYEALKSGMPAGTFTVASASRAQQQGWFGNGSWKPLAAEPSKPAGDDSAKREAKPEVRDDDPDRPMLRKPTAPAADSQAAKSSAERAAGVNSSENSNPNTDPNAPTLRRNPGNPTLQANPAPAEEPLAKPGASVHFQYLAAVSDTEPANNRPLEYMWSDAERTKQTKAVTQLAIAELRKVAAQRRISVPQNATFAELAVRAFDLDYSNSPQLVFTGRFVPPPQKGATLEQAAVQKDIHVTVVARMNFDNQLMKVFSAVSDPRDMDRYPSLQFIDAVDADGDGRAELLFRRELDNSHEYVFYKLAGLSMSQLFETAPR